jgi:hypothetical protein
MLRLTYAPDDVWHGELTVEARSSGFSGKASAWFNAEALRSFKEQILVHPSRTAPAAMLKGGYFADSTHNAIPVETHVSIIISTHGARGLVFVDVYLADQDTLTLPQSAGIKFLVEPAALHRFANGLDALLGDLPELTLTSSPNIF